MNRFELYVVVVGSAIILLVALWLFLPMIWRAHRRNEIETEALDAHFAQQRRLEQKHRLIGEQMDLAAVQMAGIHVSPPGLVIPLDGDPRTVIVAPGYQSWMRDGGRIIETWLEGDPFSGPWPTGWPVRPLTPPYDGEADYAKG